VAVAWLGREVGKDGGPPGGFDVRARASIVAMRSPRLSPVARSVTFFGGPRFLLVATPAVAIALWIKRRHVSSLLFAGSVVGGFGLSAVLKIAYARARPDRWAALVAETTHSFPSGHTLMATVFFGGLAAVVFHARQGRRQRGLAVLGASIIVLAVAASRVYLSAHWPTDTLAGILAGLIWVLVYAAVTESVTWSRKTRGRPREGAPVGTHSRGRA